MNIGDIIEADGMKRRVTGFSVIYGVEYPNTEPYAEDDSTEDAGKDPDLSRNLSCQYCGKECGSPIGKNSHERACSMNPVNQKEGEQK